MIEHRPPPVAADHAPPRQLELHSRDNPLLKRCRALAAGGAAARKLGEVWLEGDHLLAALRARGLRPRVVMLAAQAWDQPRLQALAAGAQLLVKLPQALLAQVSGLASPPAIAAVFARPPEPAFDPQAPSVVLDRLQDAGNVGSVLRSAAAFGFHQVIALQGCAGLWSPKVLRAAMGAHAVLALHEGWQAADLKRLSLPLLGTSLQAVDTLPGADLPWPCAWALGHEGQGLDAEVQMACTRLLRIAQPGGEESLNVAAAAAVCFYESRRGTLDRRPAQRV